LPIGIFLAFAVLPAAAPLAGGEHLLSLGSRVMIFAIAAVALAVSALYAFLTGIVCLRTKGVYFIMITLAFGQMAFFTASSLAPYGGDDGLTIAARSTFAGFPLLKNERAFYYVVFVALLGTYLFLPRPRRLALRPCSARREREPRPDGDDGILRLSLSARNLCDRGHARRSVRLPARQCQRVREPRLHVLAALG